MAAYQGIASGRSPTTSSCHVVGSGTTLNTISLPLPLADVSAITGRRHHHSAAILARSFRGAVAVGHVFLILTSSVGASVKALRGV
jgi:hypothetical protein